jgi:Fe-Mn family superoxide dismutase
MTLLTNRRKFIIDSAKAGAGLYIGSAILSSCSSGTKITSKKYNTGFQQDALPYSYNALSEAIDGTTMEIHYTKHAAAYATNLQAAAKDENVDTGKSLEDVLSRMSPSGGNAPGGKLATAINESFNSFESFKTQFSDAGKNRFGSGWAWLIVDNDKKLRIGSTPNQDNPLMDVADIKGFPVLGLDVWEHAYYLRYQNKLEICAGPLRICSIIH